VVYYDNSPTYQRDYKQEEMEIQEAQIRAERRAKKACPACATPLTAEDFCSSCETFAEVKP